MQKLLLVITLVILIPSFNLAQEPDTSSTNSGCLTPFAVILLTPPNQSNYVCVNPTFTWAADIDAYTYHLQVSTSFSFEPLDIDIEELNINSYTVSMLETLNHGTLYYWRVRARNSCGYGPFATFRFSTEEKF